MLINPILLADFYKTGHIHQYPKNTTLICSNWTARSSKRLYDMPYHIVFGYQYFIKEYLQKQFYHEFFLRPKSAVVGEYKSVLDSCIGGDNDVSHMDDLHDLGYLPLHIKALREGTKCPIRTPSLALYNTKPEFYWVTNYIETLASMVLWQPSVSATIAHRFRLLADEFADKTCNRDHVKFQCHDFSMRGMSGLEPAVTSGMGHLTSFCGTDTIPSVWGVKKYYNTDYTKDLVGASVPASEHSCECMHQVNFSDPNDYEYVNFMLDQYPTGIVSIVCDGFDYWKVLTEVLPKLKNKIMSRPGKVVVRPDSGDPIKIVCGDMEANTLHEKLGSIATLWNIFEGSVNEKGYKELDSHIGLIYGDAITYERFESILTELEDQKFASNNVVFGVGSYTYQHNTRDSLGFAMKATYGEINGIGKDIFKDPKTDRGTKKSARGLIRVNEDLSYTDQVSWEEFNSGMLEDVFIDGKLVREESFSDIRNRIYA